MNYRRALAIGIAAGTLWTTGAFAQDNPPPSGASETPPPGNATPNAAGQGDDEIVVTGSRMRAESVQQTPIAVSVLTPREVADLHVNDITGLSAVAPNVFISASSASASNPFITIRGFNTLASDPAVEPGVAVYIDGIYQSIITGSLADLDDVSRVEVLRGPQGTFVGKNASAGAILITRSQPTGRFGGDVSAEYGSFNSLHLRGLLNFPIVPDTLAGKVFIGYRSRGDLVDNLAVPGGDVGGQSVFTARLAFLLTPTPNLRLYLSGDYIADRSHQQGLRNVSGPTTISCTRFSICAPDANNYLVTRATFLDEPRADDHNLTGRLEWSPGPLTVTALAGYRDYRNVINVDLDASTARLIQIFNYIQDLSQVSEELRISSADHGGLDLGGRLHWLIAGYNMHARVNSSQGQTALGNSSERSQRVVRDSWALFGHFDFEILPSLTLTGGIRFSWDETAHSYALPIAGTTPPPLAFNQSASFSNTSVEAGGQYQFTPSDMVYFRYSEGYRGGGFIGFPSSTAAAVSYQPETARSYEGGFRTGWFNDRLLLNLTLFKTDFSNLQRSAAVPAPNGGFVQVTANVAAATTKGFEVEAIAALSRAFRLRANVGYLNARFTNYSVINAATGQLQDLSSTPFPFAPKWTVSVSPELNVPLGRSVMGLDTMSLQGRFGWQSTVYVSSANINAFGLQRDYALVDASVRLSGDSGLSVTLFVKNLFDQHYITSHSNPSNLVDVVADGVPRSIGINIGYRF